MIALAVPVVLSELGWMAQGVVDNIMVGRLGPVAIGAVALGNAVYYTPSLFGIGLLLGLDTLVSQAYGRDDHDECHRWLAQGVYLACIRHSAAHAADLGDELWLHALRRNSRSSRPVRRLSAHPQLGHAAPAALRRNAALSARRGAGARDHADLRAREPAELGWQLGADLRQAGISGTGREWIGDLDMRCACGNGGWRCSDLRGATSARAAIRCFAHWAGRNCDRLRQLVRIGAPAAGQILLEVGAWNLATFAAGYLDAGGSGDARHRAELREHHLHGAAGRCCGGGGERGPRHWSGRSGARAASRMAGAGAWDWLHAAAPAWCFWWRRAR